jgi:2-polyprenyl-3-methyl-5-hydroxy-6-metoxy-1,4-benzoquinol methylase
MMTKNDEDRLQASREYWNDLASSFDDEPDHGLRNPLVCEAWTQLLKKWLPFTHTTVLDIGCGTGSLSVVLAELGYTVTGIDLSPAMISLAQAKATAHGHQIKFEVMDAAFPQFAGWQFDVIVCRHLLWALPEPEQVLQRWVKLLKQNGRLFLVEGFWKTGAGIHANELTAMLPSALSNVTIQNLSDNPNFWGGAVTDERYALIADLSA